jgi:predicted metal-dependent phosphoesterase TrpH
VPGVEINAIGELHILGYGIDPDDESFERTLAVQRDQRRTRFDRIVARLRELDVPIEDALEELAAERVVGAGRREDDSLGRPTAARALVRAGHATSVEDAFARLLGRGQPGYVDRAGLHPVAAIWAIRQAGGLAVLAHYADAEAKRATVEELVGQGLAGIEVHHRSFDLATVEAVGRVAAALRLVATGGSDYHGDDGPYGDVHRRLWVPDAIADLFRAAVRRAAAGRGPVTKVAPPADHRAHEETTPER